MRFVVNYYLSSEEEWFTSMQIGHGSSRRSGHVRPPQWQIHSGLDAHNETITFWNHAAVHAGDFVFV